MADPSVSPTDTIRRRRDELQFALVPLGRDCATEILTAVDALLAVGERDKAEIERLRESAARALITVEIAYEFILDARNGRVTEDWQGQQSAIALNELLTARGALARREET